MIIYYHCNSDNALLLYIIFTNLPSLHPLTFHEIIFILVPIVFLHQESCISELSHAHAQQKMTTPSRRTRGRAMAFILTSVEVSLELLLILIM